MKTLIMAIALMMVALTSQAELILLSEEQAATDGKITLIQIGDATPHTYTVTNGQTQWTFTSSIPVCDTITFRKIDTTQEVSVSRVGGYLIDTIPALNVDTTCRYRLGIWSSIYDPTEWVEGSGDIPQIPWQLECIGDPTPADDETRSFGTMKSMYR